MPGKKRTSAAGTPARVGSNCHAMGGGGGGGGQKGCREGERVCVLK